MPIGTRALQWIAKYLHDVRPEMVTDPREQALPDVGMVVLQDAETGEVMQVDTGSR